eukprot:m.255712 g.255712  ORF g.255712 m.255712 type:complete len:1289 (-) comp15506_c0_seq1:307-4173(-)
MTVNRGVGLNISVWIALLVLARLGLPCYGAETARGLEIQSCFGINVLLKVSQTQMWFEYTTSILTIKLASDLHPTPGWCLESNGRVLVNGEPWFAFTSAESEVSTRLEHGWAANISAGVGITRADYDNADSEGTQEGHLFVYEQPSSKNEWVATILLIPRVSGYLNFNFTLWSLDELPYTTFKLPTEPTPFSAGVNFALLDIRHFVCIDQPCVLGRTNTASCACSCTSNTVGTSVSCRGWPHHHMLDESYFPPSMVGADLGHTGMQTLPCNLFANARNLTHLSFSKGSVRALTRCTFAAMPQLARLSFRQDQFLLMEKGVFRDLTNLQYLDTDIVIRLGDLMRVNGSITAGLTNLHTWKASLSNVDFLHADMFVDNPKLTQIALDGTQLRVLPRSVFHPLPANFSFTSFNCKADSKDSVDCSCPLNPPNDDYYCQPVCESPIMKRANKTALAGQVVDLTCQTPRRQETTTYKCVEDETLQLYPSVCSVCQCNEDNDVKCGELALPGALPQMPDGIVDFALVNFCGLDILSAPSLRGARMAQDIRIEGGVVQQIGVAAFAEMPRLAKLSLFNFVEILGTPQTNTTKFYSETFWGLSGQFYKFVMSRLPTLRSLPDRLFLHMPNLNELRISITQLSEINPDWFRSLPKLKLVYIPSNPYSHLPSMFEGNPELVELAIGGLDAAGSEVSTLKWIDEQLFRNVPQLRHFEWHTYDKPYLPKSLHWFPDLKELEVTSTVLTTLRPGDLPANLSMVKVGSTGFASIAPGALKDYVNSSSTELVIGDAYSINCFTVSLDSSVLFPLQCVCPPGSPQQVDAYSCLPACEIPQRQGETCELMVDCLTPCPYNSTNLVPALCDMEATLTAPTCTNALGYLIPNEPTTIPPSTLDSSKRKQRTVILVLFTLLAVAVVLVVVWQRRQSLQNQRVAMSLVEQSIQTEMDELVAGKYPEVAKVALKEPPIVSDQFIDFGGDKYVIGRGNFATVYRATITPGWRAGQGKRQTIVIKEPLESSTEDATVSAVLEAKMMFNLPHDNIVAVLGVVWQSLKLCTIYEFMEGGDLLGFLRARHGMSLSLAQQLLPMTSIARACAHLAQYKVVHRDISARNCGVRLLPDGGLLAVKLLDFGLSRVLNDDGAYVTRTVGRGRPIRWMAPESLEDEVYSEKSDVWSFGVMCWEVMACGSRPWQDLDNGEVSRLTCSHQTLERPKTATSDSLWHTVSSCWAFGPGERPTFADVVQQLTSVSQQTRANVSVDGPRTSTRTHSGMHANMPHGYQSNAVFLGSSMDQHDDEESHL